MSTSTHILPTDKDDEVGAGVGARARGEGGGVVGGQREREGGRDV